MREVTQHFLHASQVWEPVTVRWNVLVCQFRIKTLLLPSSKRAELWGYKRKWRGPSESFATEYLNNFLCVSHSILRSASSNSRSCWHHANASYQCFYNISYLVLVQAFLVSHTTFTGSFQNTWRTYLTGMEPVLHLGFLLDSWQDQSVHDVLPNGGENGQTKANAQHHEEPWEMLYPHLQCLWIKSKGKVKAGDC